LGFGLGSLRLAFPFGSVLSLIPLKTFKAQMPKTEDLKNQRPKTKDQSPILVLS
jgi:hypothetical protein